MSTFYMGVIVPSAILLPLVIALFQYRYWQMPERLVFFYLLLSGVFNLAAKLTSDRAVNNLPLLHLYTVAEFCLLAAVFRSIFTVAWIRRALLALMILFPVVAWIYIRQTDSLFSYNVVPRFLSSLLLTGLCLYFLIRDLARPADARSRFNLIVVVGMLLYFSGASALFGLAESIRQDKELNTVIWNIHATFVLIMYLIFGVAYLNIPKTK